MSHCSRERCSQCGGSWIDPREIPVFLHEENKKNYPTMEKAEEAAAHFGWTPQNKMKPGKDVVGIEYPRDNPYHYDGISEWQCMLCDARIGRWTGKKLKDEEFEIPFGGK